MRKIFFLLLACMCVGALPSAAKHKKNTVRLSGRITSVQPQTSSFSVVARGDNDNPYDDRYYTIVVQPGTNFKTHRDRVPNITGLAPGDKVTIDGVYIDRTRIMANRLDVHPQKNGQIPNNGNVNFAPQVTNLRNGIGVPTNFNVQGQCVPNARIVVNTGDGQTFEGRSDGGGHFDVPVNNRSRRGTRLTIQVDAWDNHGNQGQPYVVQVVRQ